MSFEDRLGMMEQNNILLQVVGELEADTGDDAAEGSHCRLVEPVLCLERGLQG